MHASFWKSRTPPPECQTPAAIPSWGSWPYLLQAGLVQYTEGTQRLEEPVSKMTVKFCGGEPMEMVPKYSIYRGGREGSRGWGVVKGKVLSRGPWESSLGPESGLARTGAYRAWGVATEGGRSRHRGHQVSCTSLALICIISLNCFVSKTEDL